MKNLIFIVTALLILWACDNEEEQVFDKPAAERANEAINNLKDELTSPANGWTVKYNPESGAGSYFVLLNFNDNNTVRIRTDFGEEEGKFFDDTITYRIDNSLGLELIFENYSFFSYLYELDQASFGAEFEYIFANKTEDGQLIFTSKSDVINPTIFVLNKATPTDAEQLLGTSVTLKLNQLADDLDKFTPSLKMIYQDKDLALYFAFDNIKRTINITSASRKTDTSSPDIITFNSPYFVTGDSVVFENAFAGTYQGQSIQIKGLKLNNLTEGSIAVCSTTLPINGLSGFTSQGDAIILETTLQDLKGGKFHEVSPFFVSPPEYIFRENTSAYSEIINDLDGVLAMQLYYNYDGFYAFGFVLQNSDGSVYFALREFTPTLVDNNLVVTWTGDLAVYNTENPEADLSQVQKYLDALTANGSTYIYEYAEDIYEFYNPCTKWSFVFINTNQ